MKFWMFLLLMLTVASGAFAQTNVGKVSIDSVTNQLTENVLNAGSTHSVSIRYDLTSLPAGGWISANAFEIYSPDGANWVNLKATDGPAVLALPPEPMVDRRHIYYTSIDDGASYTPTAWVPPAPTSAPYWTVQPGGSSGVNSRVAFSLEIFNPYFLGFTGGAGGTNGVAIVL